MEGYHNFIEAFLFKKTGTLLYITCYMKLMFNIKSLRSMFTKLHLLVLTLTAIGSLRGRVVFAVSVSCHAIAIQIDFVCHW